MDYFCQDSTPESGLGGSEGSLVRSFDLLPRDILTFQGHSTSQEPTASGPLQHEWVLPATLPPFHGKCLLSCTAGLLRRAPTPQVISRNATLPGIGAQLPTPALPSKPTFLTCFSCFRLSSPSFPLAPQDRALLPQGRLLLGRLLQLPPQALQLQDQLLLRLFLAAQRLLQICFLHFEPFQEA